MVFKNSFSRLLLEAFDKNKLSVITWVALPAFPSFAVFGSQVKETSWRQNILKLVKAKAKFFVLKLREN